METEEPIILRWLSYPRTIIATLVLILLTGVYAIIVAAVALLFRNVQINTKMLRFWGYFCLGPFGISVDVEGLENLPPGGVVFVFNHTSLFDILAVHLAIPKDLRFGAKIELFRIPFFGSAMRAVGVLPIMRNQRDEVLKLYQQSIARVHAGESFVLAPEGTRQEGGALGRFKSGPFIFAINAQAPVVPLVLMDIWKILPKKHIFAMWGRWRRRVTIKVLPPLSTQGLHVNQRTELQEKTRDLMAQALIS